MGGFVTDLITVNPGEPASSIKVGMALFAAFVLLIAFFVIPAVRRKTANKPLKKVLAKCRTGVLGFSLAIFFLVWFRLEQIRFLSMRLWMYLVLLALIVWIGWKVQQYFKIKHRIERAEARRNREE